MAVGSVGLKTHIWNNNLWSMLFLGIYPLIMLGILWLIGALIGGGLAPVGVDRISMGVNSGNGIVVAYWPLMVTGISIWFVIAYFWHTRMISKMAHSHSVSRAQEPELYNLVENLCISVGMTMPMLHIIETHARNAFASGISDKSYTITVTRGLLNSLRKDEVEAVLAHELTHIRNRDVRLLMVCIIFTGMIGFAAQMMWSSVRYNMFMPRRSSGNSRGSTMMLFLAIAAVLWVGYMATLFTRFALSRKREFMADAGAVELTKNPEAMMRALMRIAGMDRMKQTSADIQMMCVENTVPFLGMFKTHPP
ncbi:MAG: M48 family metallopeptidase, partial [Alphaproteobacteria bacterium]|nr:M48 family metallopeptidase [Alphaproteobacteria bacterium]